MFKFTAALLLLVSASYAQQLNSFSNGLPATANITAQDVGSTVTSSNLGQTISTGSATANSTASFAFQGFSGIRVQTTGVWTGTLVGEISFDSGTTWYLEGLDIIGPVQPYLPSVTTNFSANVNVAGATNFRLRATAPWTGTATAAISQSNGNPTNSVDNLGTFNIPGNFANLANTYTTSTQDPVAAYLLSQIAASLRQLNKGIYVKGLLGQPINPNTTFTIPPPIFDPCLGPNKTSVGVSTASNAQVIQGMSGKVIRLCQGGVLVATTTGSISLVEGTGATCGTGTLAVIGATTAANGIPVPATSGFVVNGGQAVVPGDSICLLLSGTGLVAGNLAYAF